MKTKKKKIRIIKNKLKTKTAIEHLIDKNYNKYLEEFEEAEKKNPRRALQIFYKKLFSQELPNKPTCLIRKKIRYALLYKGYKECGIEMHPKFLTNYKAAMNFKVDSMTNTTRQLMKLEILEEEKMKKTKAKRVENLKKGGAGNTFKGCVGATLGKSIKDTWIYLFEQNEKLPANKRLSDKEITDFLYKEFPGRNSAVFKAVSSVRSKYNRGGFGFVPKTPSKPYNEKAKTAKKAKAEKPVKKKSNKVVKKVKVKKSKVESAK